MANTIFYYYYYLKKKEYMQCKYRPRSVQIVGWLVGVAVIRLAKEMIKNRAGDKMGY